MVYIVAVIPGNGAMRSGNETNQVLFVFRPISVYNLPHLGLQLLHVHLLGSSGIVYLDLLYLRRRETTVTSSSFIPGGGVKISS